LDFDVAHWFLGGKHDVRSSDYLELAATEFQIQGLELDWVGLRWDADLRVGTNGFEHRRFVGTKWQRVKKPIDQQYLINKYRVLLTRARQGLVIWVPRGSQGDVTRAESFYDPVANYLVSCGACPIDS